MSSSLESHQLSTFHENAEQKYEGDSSEILPLPSFA